MEAMQQNEVRKTEEDTIARRGGTATWTRTNPQPEVTTHPLNRYP